MQILTGLATIAFCVVGAVVGARLVVLWRRTRGFPELVVGIALFLIGAVGYPLAMIGGIPGAVSPRAGIAMVTASTFVIDFAFVLVATFTWSVFRRASTWGRALLGALALGYAGHAIGVLLVSPSLTTATELMTAAPRVMLAGQGLNFVTFGWTAVEGYAYWWKLRKRVAIGLGDPVVANRFLLWALSGSGSLFTNLISWWVMFQGIDFFQHQGSQAIVGFVSMLVCVCQYLAFLPPRFYVARLARTSD